MDTKLRLAILDLTRLVEEVLDNGDWPTDESDYVADLSAQIREALEEV